MATIAGTYDYRLVDLNKVNPSDLFCRNPIWIACDKIAKELQIAPLQE